MLKIDKKQVKLISLAIAVFFVLGIVGIAVSQSNRSYAAAPSNIGIVNWDMVVSQHPDIATLQKTMQAEVEQAKKDFDTKSASMSDQAKQDYYMQTQERLSLKQQELLAPILDKVKASIKEVADAKGITIVMEKGNVVYGGQDITDDVVKKITGK